MSSHFGVQGVVQAPVVVVIHERRPGQHEKTPLRDVVKELDLAQAVLLPLRGARPLHEVASLRRNEHLARVSLSGQP